jgi:fermentation-respiration switch protein FrsA (DUF1100 family)
MQLITSCTFIVNKASFFPNRRDIVTTEHLPENVSLIRFKTSDKKIIEALYYYNDLNKKVILYFHGNAGNMYDRMPECKKMFNFGYNVFIVSYRGFSKSEGRPSEKGVYTDAESALAYLLNTCNYPVENVYVLERSLGTAVAVDLCQNKNIKKLVLVLQCPAEGILQMQWGSVF